MKRFILPLAIVVSGLLFSCATTNAVPESKPDATQVDEVKIVESDKNVDESIKESKEENLAEPQKSNTETDESATISETDENPAETQDEEDLEPEITEPEEETIEVFETVGLTKKVASLESAEKIANFKMVAPKTFAVYKPSEYSVQDDYKISVTYKNTKNAEESFVVRKAVGNLDVSEDFKKYSFTKIFVENGTRVVAKGSEDGLYTLATWTGNDFTYSMESNIGFPKEVIFALVGEVN